MQTQNEVIQDMVLNWRQPYSKQKWNCTPCRVFHFLQSFTLFPFKKTKVVLKKFFENPTLTAYDYVPVFLSNLVQGEADMLFAARGAEMFFFEKISPNLRGWISYDINVFNRKAKAEIHKEIPASFTDMVKPRRMINSKGLQDWQLVNLAFLIYGIEFDSLVVRMERFLMQYQALCIIDAPPAPRSEEPVNEDELMEIGFIRTEEVCPICKGPYEGIMLTSTICKHPGSIHQKCYNEYEAYRISKQKNIECPFNGCSLNLSRLFFRSNENVQQIEIIEDNGLECIVID